MEKSQGGAGVERRKGETRVRRYIEHRGDISQTKWGMVRGEVLAGAESLSLSADRTERMADGCYEQRPLGGTCNPTHSSSKSILATTQLRLLPRLRPVADHHQQ